MSPVTLNYRFRSSIAYHCCNPYCTCITNRQTFSKLEFLGMIFNMSITHRCNRRTQNALENVKAHKDIMSPLPNLSKNKALYSSIAMNNERLKFLQLHFA